MRKRDILLPVLLSAAVFPGAGQIRNGERLKGILMAVATIGLLGAFTVGVFVDLWPLVTNPPEFGVLVAQVQGAVGRSLWGQRVVLTLLVAVWVYSVVDAFLVARSLDGA